MHSKPEYPTGPRYIELYLIVLIGVLQPMTEVTLGTLAAFYYNFAAAGIMLCFIGHTLWKYKSPWRVWGVRIDTVKSSIPLLGSFSLLAAAVIYGLGAVLGNTPLPASFWYLLGLYPIWGFAQQFVLQNFVTKNLTVLVPSITLRCSVVAAIFSIAHFPSLPLMAATVSGGFFLTYIYTKTQNMLTLAISHGLLGALTFYLILGADQMAVIESYL